MVRVERFLAALLVLAWNGLAATHLPVSDARGRSPHQKQRHPQELRTSEAQVGEPTGHDAKHSTENVAKEASEHNEMSGGISAGQKEILELHEAPTPVSDAVALMLLGMVAFQISLFYLVNFPDKDIQRFTWTSLAKTVSIFCALNIWHVIKATVEFCTHEHEEALGSGAPLNTELTLLLLFVILFVGTQMVMAALWQHKLASAAFGAISAHTLGFSAVDTFGEIVQMHPWRDSWWSVVVGATITSVVLLGAVHATTRMRKSRCADVEAHDEDEHELVEHYMEVCAECENEFIGFVLGLLFTQAMIFAITDNMPPLEGYPFEKTKRDVFSLGAGSMGTALTLVLFIIGVRKVYKDERSSPAMARAIEIIEMALSMTVGWSLLYCGRWTFWVSTSDHGVGQGDIMSARTVQALCFSFFVFLNIFVMDWFADRGILDITALRALMSAMGLLLGLSWEGAFGEALESLGREFADQPTMHLMVMNTMGITLCAIVLPGWAMCILPNSLEQSEVEPKKAHEARAIVA